MVPAEVHAHVAAERDDWKALAEERLTALEKLKEGRHAEHAATLRTAGRLMQFAWILMVVIVVFVGTIIVAGALRAHTRECPPLLERP